MEKDYLSEEKKSLLKFLEFSRLDFKLMHSCPVCESPIIHLATCDICPQCGSLAGCWD